MKDSVEVWGGIECSFNRVANQYMDQLDLSGHYERKDDIEKISQLGIKALRYPVLWEKHCAHCNTIIDWTEAEESLNSIKEKGIKPIVGLVHHGSGPVYADFFDGTFAIGLAEFAEKVATKFPWIEYYTPVNEPLTTARFCGLYGHWYPHRTSNVDFFRILLAECKGTILAMEAIRRVNPNAKLLQTEDLGKTHSSSKLIYQRDFENRRRWLSFDILLGKVNESHELWHYLMYVGITAKELQFFQDNPCPPNILGINHYVTSERYLDERIEKFPSNTIGGNGLDIYADVEAVRVGKNEGPEALFEEVWDRFAIPIAITEVHLHCTREEQLRWFNDVWLAVQSLKNKGADIKAVTAWALLGSYDWCSLLTKPNGIYEPGVFDVRTPEIRPTALAKMIKSLATTQTYKHPVLDSVGWWKSDSRIHYHLDEQKSELQTSVSSARPLLIIGKTGTLGKAFERICSYRGLACVMLGRNDIDILDLASITKVIDTYKPWAIINAAGYVRVDDAEKERENCFYINTVGPTNLSIACQHHGISFVTFSSDLVFDGKKKNPYLESDLVSPINIYGQSKAQAEEKVLINNPSALIIRTSAFFGPWDQYNFVYNALHSFKSNQSFDAVSDVIISPTYVPDLVFNVLDLLIDEATGIWNMSNKGEITWAMLAKEVAERAGYDPKTFKAIKLSEAGWLAPRPSYSVLKTEKGFELPSLESALDRFFREQELLVI